MNNGQDNGVVPNNNQNNAATQGIQNAQAKGKEAKDSRVQRQAGNLKGAKRDSKSGLDSNASKGSSGNISPYSSSSASSKTNKANGNGSNINGSKDGGTSGGKTNGGAGSPLNKIRNKGSQSPLSNALGKKSNGNQDKAVPGVTTAGRIVNALKKGKDMAKGKVDQMSAKASSNDEESGDNDSQEQIENNPSKEAEQATVTVSKVVLKIALLIVSFIPVMLVIIVAVIVSLGPIQKVILKMFLNNAFEQDEVFDYTEETEENDDGMDNDLPSTDDSDSAFINLNKNYRVYLKPNSNFIDDNYDINNSFTAKSAKDIDLSFLNNYYKLSCSGNACEKTDAYRFYRKLYDIYFLYKYKYGVKIDLALITAALDYNTENSEETFKANLNNYDVDEVRDNNYDNDNITDLDWECDYKNKDGYKYLNANDSRYDMQILAKNMVTKKVTYSCTDGDSSSNDNSSSNSSTSESTSSKHEIIDNDDGTKTVNDVETSNYENELKCDGGSYDEDSINVTYELDKQKYDEFLLEYIEHKYYLSGYDITNNENKKESSSSSGSNSMAQAMVKVAQGELEKFNKGKSSASTYQGYTGVYDAWCASFISYIVGHTEYGGKKLYDIIPVKSAAVSVFADHFLGKGKLYHNTNCTYYKNKPKYSPKPGDIVIFNNGANNIQSISIHQYQDHIGMVEKITNNTIYTIEGNTGNGVVARNQFALSDCRILAYGSWY